MDKKRYVSGNFASGISACMVAAVASLLLPASCGVGSKVSDILDRDVHVGMSIPWEEDRLAADDGWEDGCGVVRDTTDKDRDGGGDPLIMNAVRETSTGDMVATDVISASRVVARFRNVAERGGAVSLEFDITVPPDMIDSRWKLKFLPKMDAMGRKSSLEPLYITGERYRAAQLRGYERYQAFLASIITDSSVFVRIDQLEKFLMRYYPGIYAMKTDSSFVSDPEAENLFGVSQREALEHYTRHALVQRNENRKKSKETMFRKYVKDPIVSEGLRLDTVLAGADGALCYRYVQNVRSFPGLRKITVSLDGEVYADGKKLLALHHPDSLVFYVSSLSSLVDDTPKYQTVVRYRRIYDNTSAFIDFSQGSAEIDTLLEGNVSELSRIRKCIEDISSKAEYVLDSMTVTASCSPEGDYGFNSRLAGARALSVLDFVRSEFPDSLHPRLRTASVPENWARMKLLVRNDSTLSPVIRDKIMSVSPACDKDSAETALSSLPGYIYLREKIYPRLRSVKFEFWLHRPDMAKDTVHTAELDTAYMSGVEAIRNLDYRKAVSLLRQYSDYNSALACLSAGYEETALEILAGIRQKSAKANYLAALVMARLDMKAEAMEYYSRSVIQDPSMRFRANLDPELSPLLRKLNDEETYITD